MRFQKILALLCGLLLVGSAFVPTLSAQTKTLTWQQALQQAKGSTVNFAMWGGSDQINQFVDGWVAGRLKQEYGVTLNRIPLTDTVEAVNKVAGEVQAGLKTGGSIDLIWINGENFRTLKQGNLLHGPFTQALPSIKYYDPNKISVDFGLPIDGFEAPYTGSYYVMAYDSAKVKQPPKSYSELLSWAKANPGRFSYVAPPAFDGSRFLLTTFYATTGGFQQYLGPQFKPDLWQKNSGKTFAYLKELEPHLWRQGSAYPPTQNRLSELFANGEIWMMPSFVSTIALGLANKQFPPSTKAFAIPGATLSDPSFTAIPINAKNVAGAMALANVLASPEGQLEKFKPEVWGDPPLLDLNRLSTEQRRAFAEVEKRFGLPLQELTAKAVPVVNAEYTTRLEQEWQKQIAPN